jgi:hypothetical protein
VQSPPGDVLLPLKNPIDPSAKYNHRSQLRETARLNYCGNLKKTAFVRSLGFQAFYDWNRHRGDLPIDFAKDLTKLTFKIQ